MTAPDRESDAPAADREPDRGPDPTAHVAAGDGPAAGDATTTSATPPDLDRLDAVIRAALDDRELAYDRRAPGRYFVTLPGTTKLQTNCWLIVTRHALLVEAFVCRRPDEDHERVYRYLLLRNARLYGVHYTIDAEGDIYLVGRVGLHAVTDDELDRLLGQVAEAADGDFNPLLEIGFRTAIKREWDWRLSRGESTANLGAFAHLRDD